jgi:hypothetical protein
MRACLLNTADVFATIGCRRASNLPSLSCTFFHNADGEFVEEAGHRERKKTKTALVDTTDSSTTTNCFSDPCSLEEEVHGLSMYLSRFEERMADLDLADAGRSWHQFETIHDRNLDQERSLLWTSRLWKCISPGCAYERKALNKLSVPPTATLC